MNQNRSNFMFRVGSGALHRKGTPAADIYTGRIALPEFGQCYIDGVRKFTVDEEGHRIYETRNLELAITQHKTRRLIAHISMPSGPWEQREGKVRLTENPRKGWKIQATMRTALDQHQYLALRLPTVKSQPSAGF